MPLSVWDVKCLLLLLHVHYWSTQHTILVCVHTLKWSCDLVTWQLMAVAGPLLRPILQSPPPHTSLSSHHWRRGGDTTIRTTRFQGCSLPWKVQWSLSSQCWGWEVLGALSSYSHLEVVSCQSLQSWRDKGCTDGQTSSTCCDWYVICTLIQVECS